MIHIDRSAVREPKPLKRLRDQGLKHARHFFVDIPAAARRQERYFNPFWAKAYPVPIPALSELFHGKCAFCESRVEVTSPGVLDHLRPKWATRGMGNEYAPDHYWWLAFAWDNLYLTCPACNKHRGPRFPVEGRRSGPSDDLNSEKPLLIDPCRDDPTAHLRFASSGRVSPLSKRGDVTIKLVALNRSDLVARRKDTIKTVDSVWHELMLSRPGVSRELVKRLNELTSKDAEFSACASQSVMSHLKRAGPAARQGLGGLHVKSEGSHDHKHVVQSNSAQLTPKFIDEIRLENFRGIGKLTIRTPRSDSSNQDWLMLIGENAAGKSSILQGIALNLMSESERQKLALSPKPFIKRGTTRAIIELLFRSDETPRRLTISNRGFQSSDPKAGVPLMAYGATRLPPRPGTPARTTTLENLFNPFSPLLDPVAWLVKLARGTAQERADFDYAARALTALLPGKPRRWRFRAGRNDVIVDPEGPLRQLSDGYQSVIGLACDVMATMHQSFRGGMEAAEGIVLIDELGAHLHPQWKMRLTKVLRQAFPRLQCVTTTHDPLCLRGLRNGEVMTIEKTTRGRVFARTDLPPIEGMRVDQILLSEYFGLKSSMDPDVEAQFNRMYRLKAKPSSVLTAKQRKELARLEEQLAPHEVYGSTRAERLMLSEINRYLAREQDEPDTAKRKQRWAAAQASIARRIEKESGIAL